MRLNEMRENCVAGWVVSLQAVCRRHLGIRKLRKLKVTKASSDYTVKMPSAAFIFSLT